ncbi:MAG: hypothetical protein EAZ18_26930 [Oscillatoriales cyanobacterium]|nr:MAG: hypothetical protein EAZ18_26930 [Oscillatoriales cyanobacterium]
MQLTTSSQPNANTCTEEFEFPECQYIANGLDLDTAQQLGDTYRAGDVIEPIGDEVADRISNRLNEIQSESQRYPLEK